MFRPQERHGFVMALPYNRVFDVPPSPQLKHLLLRQMWGEIRVRVQQRAGNPTEVGRGQGCTPLPYLDQVVSAGYPPERLALIFGGDFGLASSSTQEDVRHLGQLGTVFLREIDAPVAQLRMRPASSETAQPLSRKGPLRLLDSQAVGFVCVAVNVIGGPAPKLNIARASGACSGPACGMLSSMGSEKAGPKSGPPNVWPDPALYRARISMGIGGDGSDFVVPGGSGVPMFAQVRAVRGRVRPRARV